MADIRLQAKRDTIQLPLYSTEEAYASTNSASTGKELNRQVLVNMFPVINKDPLRDDGGEVRLLTRPGLQNPVSTNSDIRDGGAMLWEYSEPLAVLGMRGTPNETLIVAYADNKGFGIIADVYAYCPGVSTTYIGQINLYAYGYTSHKDVVLNITEFTHGYTGTTFTQGFAITFHPRTAQSTSSNSDMYYAFRVSGAWAPAYWYNIADADFPTNTPAKGIVGPMIQLNNVHYVLTQDGFIYGSYPSDTGPFFFPDITNWNAVGNTTASQDMDGGVTLVRYKHHLLAFGTASMEMFSDEGLAKPGLPIARTQQAYAKIGMANSKAWCVIDDELFWVGVSQDTGSIGLYKLSGYTPELISSIPQSHFMTVAGRYDAELYSFNTLGTTHIVTNIGVTPGIKSTDIMGADEPDNNTFSGSWIYCTTSKSWWIWAFEFTDYVSNVLSNGNGISPQLRIAATVSGSQAVRWVYVCGFKDSVDESFSMHPCKLTQASEASDSAVYDKFRVNNSATTLSYRIPVAVRTNRYQFNSLNRKTIHKIKLQSRKIYDESNVFLPAEEWKLYVTAWKDTESDNLQTGSGQATPEISRTIDLELPAYNPFLNMYNFGTCRSMVLQLLSNNAYPLELGHFEVTLSLADH